MTGENRSRNAGEEMERARECLREARILLDSDLPYGAASRAYYAVFHATRALLFSIGLEVKSHRAAISLLGEHFVKPGRLPPELGRLASRMQRDREDADYVTGTVFTDAEVRQIVSDAERFLEDADRLLAG